MYIQYFSILVIMNNRMFLRRSRVKTNHPSQVLSDLQRLEAVDLAWIL